MKKLIFFILMSLNIYSQPNIDAKILYILQKEKKAAEVLVAKSKNARNYYRLYNSRIEILKFKGKKLRELKFRDKNSNAVKRAKSDNFEYFKASREIGDLISRKYKNFENDGKFYLLHGLMIAEYQPMDTNIPVYLKKGVTKIKEKGLKSVAAGKLADYYYNNAKFSPAIQYYSMALKIDRNSEWKERYLYNRAWCYFKKDEYGKSVSNLLEIFNTTKKKNAQNYFYMQSRKKIPEFYVFAGKPDSGLKFILNKGDDSVESLTAFVKYVYSKGFFKQFDNHVRRIESHLSSKNKKKDLLQFRVDMFNHLVDSEFKKSRKVVISLRDKIFKSYKTGGLSKDQKLEFKQKNIDLLNNNIKFINDKKTKEKDSYFAPILEDTISIVRVLKQMSPKESDDYDYKLAQIYNSLNQKDKAIRVFERLYQSYKNKKEKKKDAVKILEEILAYYDKKNSKKETISKKELAYFNDYLKIGNDKEIKKTIYLRLYDKAFKKKDYPKTLEIADSFYKTDPKDVKRTSAMILNLISVKEVNNDSKFYEKLKQFVNTRPNLAASSELQKALREGYKLVSTQKINSLLEGKDGQDLEKADKLYAFFKDKKLDLNNRLISGFNASVLYNKAGANDKAYNVLNAIVSGATPELYKDYSAKIEQVAKKELFHDEEFSMKVMKRLFTRDCKDGKESRNRHFELIQESLFSKGNFSRLVKLYNVGKKCNVSQSSLELFKKLSLEYLNWNEPSEVKEFTRLVVDNRIYNSQDIQSFTEQYLLHLMNSLETVEPKQFLKPVKDLEAHLSAFQVSQNSIVKTYKMITTLGASKLDYNRSELTDENVAEVVEKNLDLFSKRLKRVTDVNTSIPVLIFYKKIVENTVFSDFLDVFNNIKFKEGSSKDELAGLIKEIIDPFRAKHLVVRKAVNSNLNKRISLRYKTMREPNYIIYRGDNFESFNF